MSSVDIAILTLCLVCCISGGLIGYIFARYLHKN